MLHVVDAYPEGVMADIEAAQNARGVLEVHGDFREEVAIEQVVGTEFQRLVEARQVQALQQVGVLRRGLEPLNHLLGGHHQL